MQENLTEKNIANKNIKKKIAIIGSGISGLTAAYYLHKDHDICVYEADSRVGGHTATKDILIDNKNYAIDTGFIVFNDWTYPHFIKLLDELNVESKITDMGFSVFNPVNNFEYAGNNLYTIFSQKRNFFSLSHWKMLCDIVRFNRAAVKDLTEGNLYPNESLGEYLLRNKYSTVFKDRYLLPMGAAIWSATPGAMLDFPIEFFTRFFNNHGLLNIINRPQWRVIKGGSSNYIKPLIKNFEHNIQLNSAVSKITRHAEHVAVTANNNTKYFDEVIIACHSDQALKLLANPTPDEEHILGAIAYQKNSVILHTDTQLLPRQKSTWSSWNYLLQTNTTLPPILTYSMNILQGINSTTEFLVTLNAREKINPQKILGEYEYAHPVFNPSAIQAQSSRNIISGINRTWYCGAYWFNGFHEDGVKSALDVVNGLRGA